MSDTPKPKRKRNVAPDKARERAIKAGKASGKKKDSTWGSEMVKRRWAKRPPKEE